MRASRPGRLRRRIGSGVRGLLLLTALGSAAPLAGQPQSLDAAGAGGVRSGDVVIRYWPGQRRLAESLLPARDRISFVGMPDDLLDRGSDVLVLLAPDAARFDSLTGGRVPEWGAGVALPRQGIIVIPGYVSDRTGTHTLPVTLRHELAHVALQRHLGDADVPRWFTEGYATWAAGEFDQQEGWMLRLALAAGRAPPLDSLTLDWPLIAADARLAYMLSASAVRYLYTLGSPATFERFLAHWADSGSFESALRKVYVVASPQFERLWRDHVRSRYGWLQVIAQTLFVWSILAALVLVLFVIRRRRNRGRLDVLREDEVPDEPAYWMPEYDPDVLDEGDGGTAGSGKR